jgi:hypothetical protein
MGMTATAIETVIAEYLDATGGNPDAALRAAVADLLLIHDEAVLRRAALDQWVSRGYVRGRASDILAASYPRNCPPDADPPSMR